MNHTLCRLDYGRSPLTFPKVNSYTRSGKNGRLIICPHCDECLRVFHFNWSSLECEYCKKSTNKYDFEVFILGDYHDRQGKLVKRGWE